MNGVSGRVLSSLIAGAKRRGISVARISEDIGLDVNALTRSSVRVPWESFTRILDRLSGEIGGPVEIRRFSEEQLASDALGIFRAVGRVLASPRDVYALGVRWIGPSLFPMMRAEMWDGADGILMQRLTLQPGHRDCPALFHILHGALIVLPRSWGHGESEVSLELGVGSATYSIRPRTIRRGPLSRIGRAFRTRFAFPTMLLELEDQQRAINASYQELHSAHDRISAQAADLARVDSIGRELSKDVDLDRVIDALIRVLTEELGFRGAELSLAEIRGPSDEIPSADPAPMRCVRAVGTKEGMSAHRYVLESADRHLGDLMVFDDAAPDEIGATRLLALLMPWIALAIDNSMTYARLERHAEILEERVNERTARLLAANHHLIREIDERKRTADALLQSEAQLRASERLASIGTLAAGIAHEINNPIGSILAAAQLAQILRPDATAAPQIDTALGDIVSEAKRCGTIVRSVLQFAREERTDKWDCDLRELVARSARLATPFAAKSGTQLFTDLPAESARVHANPTQMEQAIVNLIRNAVQSGSSRVEVRLVRRPTERLVAIEVHDDGMGIPESDRLRILEPFYTTRRQDGGTGLGLSVVHGIALEHGGTLAIESHPGRGSMITLMIPSLPIEILPSSDIPSDSSSDIPSDGSSDGPSGGATLD